MQVHKSHALTGHFGCHYFGGAPNSRRGKLEEKDSSTQFWGQSSLIVPTLQEWYLERV